MKGDYNQSILQNLEINVGQNPSHCSLHVWICKSKWLDCHHFFFYYVLEMLMIVLPAQRMLVL